MPGFPSKKKGGKHKTKQMNKKTVTNSTVGYMFPGLYWEREIDWKSVFAPIQPSVVTLVTSKKLPWSGNFIYDVPILDLIW